MLLRSYKHINKDRYYVEILTQFVYCQFHWFPQGKRENSLLHPQYLQQYPCIKLLLPKYWLDDELINSVYVLYIK